DLAGLDAGRAHVEPLLVATRTSHVNGLDVRVPPAAGAAVGVRHRLTEAGAFPADIAHSGHRSSSSSVRVRLRRIGRYGPGQPRIPTALGNHQNDQQGSGGATPALSAPLARLGGPVRP